MSIAPGTENVSRHSCAGRSREPQRLVKVGISMSFAGELNEVSTMGKTTSCVFGVPASVYDSLKGGRTRLGCAEHARWVEHEAGHSARRKWRARIVRNEVLSYLGSFELKVVAMRLPRCQFSCCSLRSNDHPAPPHPCDRQCGECAFRFVLVRKAQLQAPFLCGVIMPHAHLQRFILEEHTVLLPDQIRSLRGSCGCLCCNRRTFTRLRLCGCWRLPLRRCWRRWRGKSNE